MSRVKRGVTHRKRHKRLLKLAEGYVRSRSSLYRSARETVERALAYAFRDRKQRKRDFRRLWITRINAAAREHQLSYSQLMNGLHKSQVEIDRKMLAEMAVNDPQGFSRLAALAKEAIAGR